MDGNYNGTLAQILGLVRLKLKVMVASGDRDLEKLELLGDKVLGHEWDATSDKFIFRVTVNLTPAKMRKRSQTVTVGLTEDDIPRLPGMVLTKRILLVLVNSHYAQWVIFALFSSY